MMVLFYGSLAYRTKSALMVMILSGERHMICSCEGLISQLFDSNIFSPHNHCRHRAFELGDHLILSCQMKNSPRNSSGNLLISVVFCSSCLRIPAFWTGAFANIITNSGDDTAVFFATRKNKSFLAPLKLIILCQSKLSIFQPLSDLDFVYQTDQKYNSINLPLLMNDSFLFEFHTEAIYQPQLNRNLLK